MEDLSKDWLAEIERRAAIYDRIAEDGEGRMTAVDYLGLAALTLVLVIGFWKWVV